MLQSASASAIAEADLSRGSKELGSDVTSAGLRCPSDMTMDSPEMETSSRAEYSDAQKICNRTEPPMG